MRRRSVSPAAAALAPLPDNDDMLEEILLRLPPRPSSLPRASFVCKRWLRLVSDPRFLRRFRAFHRRNPPLLGFFQGHDVLHFIPALDPPNRIPSARFSHAPLPRGHDWRFLGCRHGLALLLNRMRLEVTVWDPVAGDQRVTNQGAQASIKYKETPEAEEEAEPENAQRRVAVPPELLNSEGAKVVRQGALLCDCEDGRVPLEAFKVVLLADDWQRDGDAQVFASIYLYESETSVWSNLTSTSIRDPPSTSKPSILVGNSFCWLLLRFVHGVFHGYGNGDILEFNLGSKSLSVIKHLDGAHVTEKSCFQILRMGASGLGLAILSDGNIQLWERNSDSVSVARWMLHQTIDLGKLLSLAKPLSLGPSMKALWLEIQGYEEDGHVIFISTVCQLYMIQLKTMEFRVLFDGNLMSTYHPYTSFYATESRDRSFPAQY
ncbi:unnamed protein product [Urochloa decumbens]|uniref:F-box domain-containing protein n=1 Tax=Urochloa decumbens TaxID=240449 RepID=A0ABC8VC84_9POAL